MYKIKRFSKEETKSQKRNRRKLAISAGSAVGGLGALATNAVDMNESGKVNERIMKSIVGHKTKNGTDFANVLNKANEIGNKIHYKIDSSKMDDFEKLISHINTSKAQDAISNEASRRYDLVDDVINKSHGRMNKIARKASDRRLKTGVGLSALGAVGVGLGVNKLVKNHNKKINKNK